jgi:hypothetical protein
MPWVRIDDHFDEHPKLAAAGPLAWALWMAGLAYCNRNLTDGFIPFSTAHGLVSWMHLGAPDEQGHERIVKICVTCGMHGEDVTSDYVIDLLLTYELWEQVSGGYYVHDYPEYQRTKAEIESSRQSYSERGKKGAGKRWNPQDDSNSHSSSHNKRLAKPMANRCPNPNPNPNPNPTPDPTDSTSKKKSDAFASLPIPVELNTPEFREALGFWVEMRRKKRNPPTEHALTLAVASLAQRPKDAIPLLELCTVSGWTGLKWEYLDNDRAKSNGNGKSKVNETMDDVRKRSEAQLARIQAARKEQADGN